VSVYRVYVSSNYRMNADYDLQEYRGHLNNEILEMGFYPHIYEIFEEKTPISKTAPFLYSQLEKADIFLGIYAIQYGFIPDTDHQGEPNKEKKSTVEMEYEWSQNLNIPCSFYMLRDDTKFLDNFSENELGRSRLKALKERIKHENYVNFFGPPGDLLGQVHKDLEDNRRKLDEERRDTVRIRPLFGLPDHKGQVRADIFVIMPFGKWFGNVARTIQSLQENTKLKLKGGIARGDDFFSKNDVVTDIWNAIYHSKVVIADCTGQNANVFYELGIAHTLGKPAVLITKDLKDVPFDLRHWRVISYNTSDAGLRELGEKLSDALQSIMIGD